MTKTEFALLLKQLADAWSRRDYPTASGFFAEQIRYADPLRYSFHSNEELQHFFQADEGQDQQTQWHTVIFDEAEQVGAAEYTYSGSHIYHGVAIIKVHGGKITHWREHQHIDNRSWTEFAGETLFR